MVSAIPPEPYAETSFAVAAGGLALLLGLLILIVVIVYARGRNAAGSPDAFDNTVKIHEVTRRWRLTYAPSAFCPSKETHKRGRSKWLFKSIWGFLISWLTMCGSFLVIVAVMKEVEIFRHDKHPWAAGAVGGACILCAAWLILVRRGALTDEERARLEEDEQRARVGSYDKTVSTALRHESRAHITWMLIAAFANGIAWLLVLFASAHLQPWTLPGPQYGTLLLLGPGYGLFGGWLLYATTIGFGMASAADSYPDGIPDVAPDGGRQYRGSCVIVFAAIVAFVASVAIPDPAMALPMAFTVAFFTPRYRENLIAVAICTLGLLLAIGRVVDCRSDDPIAC